MDNCTRNNNRTLIKCITCTCAIYFQHQSNRAKYRQDMFVHQRYNLYTLSKVRSNDIKYKIQTLKFVWLQIHVHFLNNLCNFFMPREHICNHKNSYDSKCMNDAPRMIPVIFVINNWKEIAFKGQFIHSATATANANAVFRPGIV